jgi:hypothetical protein
VGKTKKCIKLKNAVQISIVPQKQRVQEKQNPKDTE